MLNIKVWNPGKEVKVDKEIRNSSINKCDLPPRELATSPKRDMLSRKSNG